MKLNRNSTLFKIGAAFLCLVLIPSLVGISYLTRDYEKKIQDDFREDTEARLNTLKKELNTTYLDINRMLLDIQQDEAMSRYRLRKNSYHVMIAMEQLQRYKVSNSMVHTIAYYDPVSGLLFSSVSTDNTSNFLDRYFLLDDVEKQIYWNTVVNSRNTQIANPSVITAASAGNSRILTYAVNLDRSQRVDVPKLLIMLDAAPIEFQMASMLPMDSASMLVTDPAGRVLFSAGELPPSLLRGAVPDTVEEEQISSIRDGDDYVVTGDSSASGWRYLMFTPVAELLEQVRGAIRMYSLFAVALIVVSVLFFAISYKYNFLPLRRIAAIVRMHYDGAGNANEYDIFYQSYQALTVSNQTMRRQIDEALPRQRNYLLSQLLSGSVGEEEAVRELKALGMNLGQLYLSVVMLFPAEFEQPWALPDMEECLHEYLGEHRLGYCIEGVTSHHITLLLALPYREQDTQRLEIARLQEMLTARYGIHSFACIGEIYQAVADIPISFQEAAHTSRYRYRADANKRLAFSDTGEDGAFSRNYPILLLRRFHEALEQGDSDGVCGEIRAVWAQAKDRSLVTCRSIYCDMAFAVFRHFQRQGPELRFAAIWLDDIGEALETRSMPGLERLVSRLEHNYRSVSEKGDTIQLKDRTKQYIDSHFRSAGFSIQEMADELEVSSGHLSRCFKKETGETLLSYVNEKRIEEAKRLLAETNLTLNEIVREIGYVDVSSFHRKFKSMLHETPGAYRDRVRGEATEA